MAIVGLLLGIVIGLFATGFMVSVIVKVVQVLFLAVTRLALCILWNVTVLVSILVIIGIVWVGGDQASPWLLLLGPLIGLAVALAFLKSMLREIADFFGVTREGNTINGNQT